MTTYKGKALRIGTFLSGIFDFCARTFPVELFFHLDFFRCTIRSEACSEKEKPRRESF